MAKIPMTRGLYNALIKPYRDASDFDSMPTGRGVSLMRLREFVEWGQDNYDQSPECVQWLTDKLSKLDLNDNDRLTAHKFFKAFGLLPYKLPKHYKRNNLIRYDHNHCNIPIKDLVVKYGFQGKALDRKTIYLITKTK